LVDPNFKKRHAIKHQYVQVEENGIPVARLNSLESYTWAPEMIAYGVEAVPCIVLLDSQGEREWRGIINTRVFLCHQSILLILGWHHAFGGFEVGDILSV